MALWLDGDAASALKLAKSNLNLQREPVDWWAAVQAARLAKDSAALAQLEAAINAAGLHDARLALAAGPAPKGVAQ